MISMDLAQPEYMQSAPVLVIILVIVIAVVNMADIGLIIIIIMGMMVIN